MNVEETKRIIAIIESNFPSKEDDDSLRLKIATWYESFKHIDYEEVHKALFMVIQKTRYKPTIADVNDELIKLKGNQTNEFQAWETLRNAIKYGSNFTIDDFFRLPEEIRNVVEDGSKIRTWASKDSEYIEKYVMNDFIKRYREMNAKKKDLVLLNGIQENRIAITNERK